jgi:hypothetical protein
MMYAVISALGDPASHQLSYRSHAEAFLGRFDKDEFLRNQLENHYKRNRHIITELFEERVTKSSLFKEWKTIYSNLIKESAPLFIQNKLLIPEADHFTSIIKNKGWELEEEGGIDIMSDFHKLLSQIRPYEKVKSQIEYKVKRLLFNFMYLTMVQLGIKGTEKFSMCYSISRWFEDKLREGWKEQLVRKYANTL